MCACVCVCVPGWGTAQLFEWLMAWLPEQLSDSLHSCKTGKQTNWLSVSLAGCLVTQQLSCWLTDWRFADWIPEWLHSRETGLYRCTTDMTGDLQAGWLGGWYVSAHCKKCVWENMERGCNYVFTACVCEWMTGCVCIYVCVCVLVLHVPGGGLLLSTVIQYILYNNWQCVGGSRHLERCNP